MPRRALFLTVLSLIAWAFPAHAYLDPASGSMFLQLLVGGVAGVALAVKLYWRRMMGWLGRKKRGNDDDGA